MKYLCKSLLIGLLTCCLVLFSGCSFGDSEPEAHDSQSVEALPYTLYGENAYWTASYTISPISDEEKQKQQEALATIEERFGGTDSSAYQQQERYNTAYTGVFTLTFRGSEEQLKEINKYTITFASDTSYQQMATMQRNSGQEGFEEKISGKTPLWTTNFAADASVMGGIPPIGTTYELTIEVSGLKEAGTTLTMQYQP